MSDYKRLTTREMLRWKWMRCETKHPGEASKCKNCGEEIEWWLSPHNKSVPFDPCDRDDVQRVCHWDTCTDRKDRSTTKGVYPASKIPALVAIKQQIVAEYKQECEGEMMYEDREHKLNWLYKKLAEARLTLAQR